MLFVLIRWDVGGCLGVRKVKEGTHDGGFGLICGSGRNGKVLMRAFQSAHVQSEGKESTTELTTYDTEGTDGLD